VRLGGGKPTRKRYGDRERVSDRVLSPGNEWARRSEGCPQRDKTRFKRGLEASYLAECFLPEEDAIMIL